MANKEAKKEAVAKFENAVLALYGEIRNGFKGDEMKLIKDIAIKHEVGINLLMPIYNELYMLSEVEIKSDWSDEENKILLNMVATITPTFTKNNVYSLFAKLVNRTLGGVQQQYSKVTRKLKQQENSEQEEAEILEEQEFVSEEQTSNEELEEQVVSEEESKVEEPVMKEYADETPVKEEQVHSEEVVLEESTTEEFIAEQTIEEEIPEVETPLVDKIHMEGGHIEHAHPVSTEAPNLVDSLVNMFDKLEDNKMDVDKIVHILTSAVGQALDIKTDKTEEKKWMALVRQLEQENKDLAFQLEQAIACIKVMERQSQKDKEKINELQGEIWNLNSLKGTDQIRQLQKMNQYQVDMKDGMLVKKSV